MMMDSTFAPQALQRYLLKAANVGAVFIISNDSNLLAEVYQLKVRSASMLHCQMNLDAQQAACMARSQQE